MQKLIQSCKNPSDVNPEIHTFEKKLKAFEEFRIGELGFQQLQVVTNVFLSFSFPSSCFPSSCYHVHPPRMWRQMDQCRWE